MKGAIIPCLLLLALASCQNESVGPSGIDAYPLRATYTDSKTGNTTAEEVFEYNDNHKITTDTYTEAGAGLGSSVKYYEYDGNGYLVKTKSRLTNIEMPFNVTEYTYENGLKKTEKYYTETFPGYQLTEFFYSNANLPDSSVAKGMDDLNNTYKDVTIYSYDKSGHVIHETKIYEGSIVGQYDYTYDGDNLIKSCAPTCFVNEYNENGQLTKKTLHGVNIDKLQEERFYKDGVLGEKWIYVYDTYDINAPYSSITKIKFEY